MGHVDHGKTTLLDFLRKSNVAAREAGGITQSVGAYEIIHHSGESLTSADLTQKGAKKIQRSSASHPRMSAKSDFAAGRKITFIDTPGHEAFSQMRARGARAADIAILVVAADEGVKPQTQESINILTEAKTPFVVAITKIDKSNADLERVKSELAAANVLLEGYGGGVSYQPISSKTGEHIGELLDLIILTADVENLTYDPAAPAAGFVLETRMDRRRGPEATVIVRNGILKQGEPIATAVGKGKIKIMEDFTGKPVKSLEPSAPAVILGWEELPRIGEEFVSGAAVANLALRPDNLPEKAAVAAAAGAKIMKLILKAADAGSLEALAQIVAALPAPENRGIRIIQQSVGDITDGDVNHAISTGSIIAAFKSRADKGAKFLAEANGVRIMSSDIVYHLIKEIEDLLNDAGANTVSAVLEVLAVFNKAKLDKQVIGGRIAEGIFKNRAQFDIERAGSVAGSGRVNNLQQQKKDMNQVESGKEAGLMVSAAVPIEVGDRLIIRKIEP